jgi:hypothetical protein
LRIAVSFAFLHASLPPPTSGAIHRRESSRPIGESKSDARPPTRAMCTRAPHGRLGRLAAYLPTSDGQVVAKLSYELVRRFQAQAAAGADELEAGDVSGAEAAGEGR